jgi:folate-binding protein YgfZ
MMRSFMPNHEAVGELGDVDGRPVVLHYGDIEAEYAALRTGTLLVDRSLRGRLRVRGEKAKETVTGLVTNDILALEPGHGVYAAALTPKGRIIADVRVFIDGSALLIDAPARAFPGFLAMLKKFVNPRVAPFEDESATTTDLCVAGANARLVLAEAFGAPSTTLGTLPPYGHIAVEVDGATILVARTPEVGVDAFDCFVPVAQHDMLRTRLLTAGARPGGLQAWEIARIETGRPEWGLDIDETTIAQEANLDDMHAISYTKGCYTGQETVARVHFRGHVNRYLRGLVFETDDPAPPRAALADQAGKAVGEVRSGARSPRIGAVALGMVRREIEPGTELKATWEGGERAARVVRLPFPT